MNLEETTSTNGIFTKKETVPFENIPGQSRLFIDFQSGNEEKVLREFYPNLGVSSFSESVLANYQMNRNLLCEVLRNENELYGADSATFENIDKLANDNCVAVVTGQQAGLFGGPIYTIYKALSAVSYAKRLNENGIKAVPIFWIASEDHDFDEIAGTYINDVSGFQRRIDYAPENRIESVPVGSIDLDQGINHTIGEFIAGLGEAGFSQKVLAMLESSYLSGRDVATAFGALLASILKGTGLIFVSPLNESLRELSSPIFVKAVEASERIASALGDRDSKLEDAGYHSQVLVENDFFPFFYIDDEGVRHSMRFSTDGSRINSADLIHSFEKQELVDIARNAPQKLSPNALMRPIVQDYLFPTVRYFGGAAEIAYFAQNSVIFEVLERPSTPIQHRASFTFIEPKHRRTLGKYDLEFSSLFAGIDSVSADIVEKYLNPETAAVFDEVESSFEEMLINLGTVLSKSDPTLSDSLVKRKSKIDWHVKTLRRKYQTAELQKDSVIDRRIRALFETVLPESSLQERTLNALYFYNKFGENLIAWILELIEDDETDHQIVTL